MKQPIDFVVPMVFPDDPKWQDDFRLRNSGNATEHVRWRSWGTEELTVRCVMRFMPWVRTIYILLARESQVQPWMKELSNGANEAHGANEPTIRLCFHDKFIPKEYLPCFTSPTIEMFLHRIPGLAEQFVYANDDMFVLSPLEEYDFFKDGKPCQSLREKAYPVRPNVFQRKCMKQQNLVGGKFGYHFTDRWLKNRHCFAPILKSCCEAVWREFGQEISAGISPVWRTEFSYNQYIYVLWQHFTGNFIQETPTQTYAGKKVATADLRATILSANGVVCINDNAIEHDWQIRAKIAREAIMAKLMMIDD